MRLAAGASARDTGFDEKSGEGEHRTTGGRVGRFASLRDLEVLQAVIEERQATAAARRLGVSQPAVSRALTLLEERTGRVLVRREGMNLAPTADGLALYEEARPIFEILARLEDFSWNRPSTAPLRLAAPPTIAHCLIEPLLAGFIAESGVMVSLEITTTPVVSELVADRRADLAIADIINPSPSLARTLLQRSNFVCAMPDGHPLAMKSTIGIEDLQDHPLILLVKRNPARAMIDRICAKAGMRPLVVMETANALSAVNLVSRGVGLTLLNPFPVTLAGIPNVVFRPFEPLISLDTAFIYPADIPLSWAGRRFIEMISDHIAPRARD